MAKISLGTGVDAIAFGDDWGTQNRLMISKSLWREVFKPAYKRMFDTVHKRGAHLYFHSMDTYWTRGPLDCWFRLVYGSLTINFMKLSDGWAG